MESIYEPCVMGAECLSCVPVFPLCHDWLVAVLVPGNEVSRWRQLAADASRDADADDQTIDRNGSSQ